MKYFKIFKEQCKLSLMSVAIFRANFILMLIQSIINSLMSVLCVEFIYGSVDSIAGWNKHEIIILMCISLIVNQLYRGLINPNQNRFVTSISTGAFDKMLLKPISILFQINFGTIDISSMISMSAPLIILCIQLMMLGTRVSYVNIMLFILLLINGLFILTSFMMLLYSLAFYFIKVDGLNNIYFMMMSISEKPKEIFSKKSTIYWFTFILPSIPLANAPTSVLLNKSTFVDVFINICAGILFLVISILFFKINMKKYGSASS